AAPPAAAATHARVPLSEKIKQKQVLLEATRRKLQASRQQLHQARYKVMTISEALAETNASIERVAAELISLHATIRSTDAPLRVRRHQLAAIQASLDRHRDALDHRLVDVYEYGPTTYFEALLDSSSFVDFVQRWDFVHYILKADGELIAVINKD